MATGTYTKHNADEFMKKFAAERGLDNNDKSIGQAAYIGMVLNAFADEGVVEREALPQLATIMSPLPANSSSFRQRLEALGVPAKGTSTVERLVNEYV